MQSREIEVRVLIRVVGEKAKDLDQFTQELRHDLVRLANQSSRQKRNKVAITEHATVSRTYR